MFVDHLLCVGNHSFAAGTGVWAHTDSILYVSNWMFYFGYDIRFDSLNS